MNNYAEMSTSELLKWQEVLRQRYASEGPRTFIVEDLEAIQHILKQRSAT